MIHLTMVVLLCQGKYTHYYTNKKEPPRGKSPRRQGGKTWKRLPYSTTSTALVNTEIKALRCGGPVCETRLTNLEAVLQSGFDFQVCDFRDG